MGETGRKCLCEICVRTSGQQQLKQTPKRYLILYYQNSLFISHQSHLIIPDDNLPSWAHFENHYSKLSKFLLWNLVTPECISCLFFRYCSAELYWPGELSLLYALLELSIWGYVSGFYIPYRDLWLMPVPLTKVVDFGSQWYPQGLVVGTLEMVVEWVNKVSLWLEYLS